MHEKTGSISCTCQSEQVGQVGGLHASDREAKHDAGILVGLLDVALAVYLHQGIQDVSAPDVHSVYIVLHMSCSHSRQFDMCVMMATQLGSEVSHVV